LEHLHVQPSHEQVQQLVQRQLQVLPEATPMDVADTLRTAAALGVQLAEEQEQQLIQQILADLLHATATDASQALR
jgi:uncharacterized protein YdiU (UPF0061 family)